MPKFNPDIYTLKSLIKLTAAALQKAIRAEAGACVGPTPCVQNGVYTHVIAPLGFCVCITCGVILPWKYSSRYNGPKTEAGHFLASRRNSIIFEESGIHPQCSGCNKYKSGNPASYEIYMRNLYGQPMIDHLRHLRDNVSVTFSREELCQRLAEYKQRIKIAERRMIMI